MTTANEVLAFWFGPPGTAPLANAKKWFTKSASFDAECTHRFRDAIELAAGGGFDDWRTTPRGRLALVILLDQLSRNVFRDTPRSFAQDALAREVSRQALDAGDDDMLSPSEAGFLLMPLMHSENLAHQERCIAGFEKLEARADDAGDDEQKKNAANSVKYARMHAAIIERFGRFPHRNAILGRPSTPAEEEFLKEPGSAF